MKEFHINKRITDNLPEWMTKWISLILKFISYEGKSTLIDLDSKISDTDIDEINKVTIFDILI